MTDDKIIRLQDRMAENVTRRASKPTDLASQKIRDIAVKAVIYPQTITPREAQELGAAVLYHLKLFYPTSNE